MHLQVGSLVEALQQNSASNNGICFLLDGQQERRITYAEFYRNARVVCKNLQKNGLRKGAKVILYIKDNEAYLTTFWACLLGGIIPAPVAIGTQESHRRKLINIWRHAGKPPVITDDPSLFERKVLTFVAVEETADLHASVILMQLLLHDNGQAAVRKPLPETVAYIQYSSGSTGDPKGVILTHNNLLFNTIAIAARSEIGSADSSLSWMPLTHDMGLICAHLTSLLAGIWQFIMPTDLFIRRPLLWMDKASVHRCTLLYSPNFGYHYLLAAISRQSHPNWDLSTIRLIYNGAEPISHQLCTLFSETLSSHGLKKNVIYPGYGLAEASVAVCLPTPGRPITSYHVARNSLNIGQKVKQLDVPVFGESANFVATGNSVNDCQFRIVDDLNLALPDWIVGHIQIRGKNVTSGYYNDDKETSALFTKDGWLKTGDIGFSVLGQLIITGRLKNMIIINGQNYYPHDLEGVIQEQNEIEQGKVVVAGCHNADSATDEILVFVQFKDATERFYDQVGEIRKTVATHFGLVADTVIPVKRIPKTTSGKIQRFDLVRRYQEGEFLNTLEALAKIEQQRLSTLEDLSESEQRLVSVWQDIFGSIPTSDQKFNTAEFNSLKVVQLCAKIQERTGVSVPISGVFNCRNFNDVLSLLRSQPKVNSPRFARSTTQRYYPLSKTQERFWLMDRFFDHRAAFIVSQAFTFHTVIDVAKTSQVVSSLIKRHESLRTSYTVVDNQPRFYVRGEEDPAFNLLLHDLSRTPVPELAALHLATTLAAEKFDMNGSVLIRTHMIKISNDHWIFLFTAHHSIFDGWSANLFLKEFLLLYDRFPETTDSVLGPLDFQLKDDISQQWYAFANKGSDKAFWSSFLGGLPEPFAICASPVGWERNRGYEMQRYSFLESHYLGLKKIAAEYDCTLFVVLTTILNIVMHKYSGRTDFVIGTSVSARGHEVFFNQIGCYMNTLPLRYAITRDSSFADAIAAAREKTLRAFDHQYYPFEDLLDDMHRTGQRHDLFNILLLLQNFDFQFYTQRSDSSLIPIPIEMETSATPVDLQLEFIERQGELLLELRYNLDRFSASFVKGFIKHFTNVFEQVQSDVHLQISKIDLLRDIEKIQLPALTPKAGRTDFVSLVERFTEQARLNPHALAITTGNLFITYQQLDERSDQVAVTLSSKHQIGKGDRVVIYSERSVDAIVAMLAILKLDAVFIPVDPSYPHERQRFVIMDSGCKLVVSCNSIHYLASDVERVEIDSIATAGSQPFHFLPVNAQPEDIAYILYTSGSTGMPKGVAVSHFALTDYVNTFCRYFGVTNHDSVIHQSSISFDVFVEEIFPALISGAAIVVAESGGRNIDLLVSLMSAQSATILSTTPLVIDELNRCNDALPSSLRLIINGGDVLRPSHIDNLLKKIPLYNTYGPTEATVCASYCKVESLETAGCIGTALANHTLFIINEDNQLLPDEVIGELCISGHGLAHGYINQPELTRERFVPNLLKNGEIVYKTGDLAYRSPEGKFFLQGRKDFQVKVGGYRVEVGEVEASLGRVPGIKDVAVFSVSDAGSTCRLVACYTSSQGISSEVIREHLSKSLPFYALPTDYMLVNSFPSTVNGKVDRVALKKRYISHSAEAVKYHAKDPESPSYPLVIELWSKVLDTSSLSAGDNFFLRGGNSIKATQVILALQKRAGVDISLRQFFQCPTPASLAAYIDSLTPTEKQMLTTEKVGAGMVFPVSHSQRRMWLLSQQDSVSRGYNLTWAFRLAGKLDRQLMQRVVSSLFEEYEILRTTFQESKGGLYQTIHDPSAFSAIEWIDSGAQGIASVLQYYANEHLFSLQYGPLAKFVIIENSKTDHLFILSMHHSITDAWSMELLGAKIFAAYDDLSNGRVVANVSRDIQYKDIASWQNRQIETRQAELSAYWKSVFKNDIPILELPLNFSRPAAKQYKGKKFRLNIDKEISRKIFEFSSRSDTSVFTIALASLKALLYKYTSQTDIVVGTPVNGRVHADMADQLGCFINTLAVRSTFDPSMSLMDLLRLVRKNFMDALDAQLYPFDRVIEDLDVKPDVSRSVLFDVMLNYRDAFEDQLYDRQWGGVAIRPVALEGNISLCDLCFEVTSRKEVIGIDIEYDIALFSEDFVAQIAAHYQTIITQMISGNPYELRNLDILGETDKEKIFCLFNPSQASDSHETMFLERFYRQLEMPSNGIAVIDSRRELTFYTLDAESNVIANALRTEHGVGTGDIIGIMMEKSCDLIVVILAVIKTGAAYLPIDSSYPESRVKFILSDALPKLVIMDRHVPHVPPQHRLLFSRLANLHRDHSRVINPLSDHHPIYHIYTSGSSGNPKAVVVTHGNVKTVIESWRRAYELDDVSYTFLQIANPAFDVFFGDFCRSLLFGHKLVFADRDQLLDPPLFYDFLNKYHVNAMEGTPGLIMPLLKYVIANSLDFSFMRLVIIGSDTIAMSDFMLAISSFKHIRIINSYGTTETTVDSSLFDVAGKIMTRYPSVPIGRPLQNTRYYVLDTCLQPVAPGVVGELFIGGGGVAAGYLNRPELTASRFLQDPFVPGGRMYRTGDNVKWSEDGELLFLGRADNQVKIRGYRIELDEVQNAICRVPNVISALVAVHKLQGENVLIGYYVSDHLQPAILRSHLKKLLPSFMVPPHLMRIDSMPLTRNGKMDKSALPSPVFATQQDTLELTPQENKMLLVWREVLGDLTIGIDDNFFELGGHSLKAANVIGKIFDRFGVRISFKDFFAAGTIRNCALLMSPTDKKRLPIPKVSEKTFHPASHTQRRLWFLDKLQNDQLIYQLPKVYNLAGPLDLTKLEQAFLLLVQRHDSLRTNIVEIDHEPFLKITPPNEFRFRVDTADIAHKNSEQSISELYQELLTIRFSLENDPLLYVKVVKIANDKHLLMFTAHHIILDGWSVDVMIDELVTLYNQNSSELSLLRIQYKDYLEWIENELRVNGDNLKAYWLNQFRGDIPILNFPTDYPRAALSEQNKGGRILHAFDGQFTHGLLEFCAKEHVTPFIMLFACVNALLYRYTGQTDMVIGTPVAGRPHPDLYDQVGLYANTLAIRTTLQSDSTFVRFLKSVNQNIVEAFDHDLYPFDKLVDDINPERDLTRSPLFDVMIVYQNTIEGKKQLGLLQELSVKEETIPYNISKFDLTFYFLVSDDALTLDLEYKSGFFSSRRMDALISHLECLINCVIRNPESKLCEIDFLSEKEKSRLLKEFNSTDKAYRMDTSVLELINETFNGAPDAVAVRCQGRNLMRRELNNWSDVVADELKNALLPREGFVGISMHRSEKMIAIMLGIWKAGGAYVPLDPRYPDDRLRQIIDDSGLSIVITDEPQKFAGNKSLVVLTTSDLDFERPVVFAHTRPQLDALAYLIYTSGSTGKPKGVQITHGNVLSFIQWSLDEFERSDFDVVLASTSIAFDLSVFEIFFALCRGTAIELVDSSLDIVQHLQRGKVLLNTVPSVVETLLETGANFDHVTVLNMAGEVIPAQVLTQLDKERIEVRNLYGPSEDTTYSTCYCITAAGNPDIIGKPIANSKLFIVDSSLNLVPEGVPGEICMSGAGLANGYINNELLTGLKFVNLPAAGNCRVYRTGDIGRWLPDGNVLYEGRIDNQIKLRGHRIETGEIESVISEFESVTNVLVTTFQQPDNQKSLVAYVVSKPAEEETLRAFVQRRLPAYMIPSCFVFLDEFPRTFNGKIDRKKLPAPTVKITGRTSRLSSLTEAKLAKIFSKLLQQQELDSEANFFGSGGNSLTAIRLLADIQKIFGVDIQLKTIFEKKTLKEIAREIDICKAVAATIPILEKRAHYPVSAAQRRFWIQHNKSAAKHSFNITGAYWLEGAIHMEALKNAVRDLVQHHEILRTSIRTEHGTPVQIVHDLDGIELLAVTRLREPSVSSSEMQALLIADEETSFKLDIPPLFRAHLICLGGSNFVFSLVIHHIICDGWSVDILLKDLDRFYQARRLGKMTPNGAHRHQYKEFASWQNELIRQGLGESRRYWHNIFATPVPSLPLPFQQHATVEEKNHTLKFQFEPQFSAQFLEFIARTGASLFSSLLTCVNMLMYRYTNQSDIIIGTPVAGRNHYEVADVAGCFINTVPVRCVLKPDWNFHQVQATVQARLAEALNYQDFPFDLLTEELEQIHGTSPPLFNVMMLLEDSYDKPRTLGDLKMTLLPAVTPMNIADLVIRFRPVDNTLEFNLDYSLRKLSTDEMVQFGERLKALLKSITKNPMLPACDIVLSASEAEEQQAISSDIFDFNL